MESVFCPYLGTMLRFGAHVPVQVAPKAAWLSAFMSQLPTPPPTLDYTQGSRLSLSKMYLNDQLQNCVPASIAHARGLFTGLAGRPEFIATNKDLIDFYIAATAFQFNPSKPETDQGCNLAYALDTWLRYGFPLGSGYKPLGWVRVDPLDRQQVCVASWLFANTFWSIPLSRSWLDNLRPGFVWEPGLPDQRIRHGFIGGIRYDNQGMELATWGLTGKITWPALARHAAPELIGECYCVLTTEILNEAFGLAPANIGLAALKEYFAAMGGRG